MSEPTITCVHDDGSEHPARVDADGMATLPCPDWPDGWVQREPAPHADLDGSAERCVGCGAEAEGYARIGSDRYCHSDDRDCYRDETWARSNEALRRLRTHLAEDDAAALRERAERAESVARGQQKLIEAQRAEIERLCQDIDECWMPLCHGVLNERDGLLAENADRESERADVRDRVEKAEAAVGRVESVWDKWGWAKEESASAYDLWRELGTALRGDQ